MPTETVQTHPTIMPYRHFNRSVMSVSEPGVVLYAAGLKLFTEHAHLLANKHFPNQGIKLNEEMGSLPSGINRSPLHGLCLEVSRCWGGRAPAVVTQLAPKTHQALAL